MLKETFSSADSDVYWKFHLPAPPADVEGKLAWLKAMTEEQERLKKIEAQFKALINSNASTLTVAFMSEFMPPDNSFSNCEIRDDHFKVPIALVKPNGIYDKKIQKYYDEIKTIFPDLKMQEVLDINGRKVVAYIGMDSEALGCAVNLIEKEKAVKEAIAEQSEKLGKTSHTAHKHPTTEGIQILPTPATKSNKSTGGIPVKKGFQVV